MIKAIIFDAFGTLISTANGSLDAARKLLCAKKRFDIEAKTFYSKWKAYHTDILLSSKTFLREEEAFRLALDKLYCEYSVEGDGYTDADILIDTFDKRILFPEVLSAVSKLRNQYDICIGSNTDDYPLYRNLERNGLSVKRIYTSESLQTYKPKREFYTAILEDMNLPPCEVLFVGDSLIDDVFGPSRVGIKTCHVNRKNTRYTDVMPDISVSSLAELPDAIKTLDKPVCQ